MSDSREERLQVKSSTIQEPPAVSPRGPTRRLSRESDIGFVRQKMVRWFDPKQLIQTAGRAFVSSIFGTYSDRRELQSLLGGATEQTPGDVETARRERRAGEFSYWDYSDREVLWIDYVADLGDGWNSTYTIASLLAMPRIELHGAAGPLERGNLLIMGGDQVYPTASRLEYRNRMIGPYSAAFPDVDEGETRPALFSLPGNHDWYDGLTYFMRTFCQKTTLGAWRTPQERSYFAIKLPGSMWLWAADFQLESDIDLPQKAYFSRIADHAMNSGDQVILCIPEPSWVYTATSGKPIGENLTSLVKTVSRARGCRFDIWLAGDLHHYSRYSCETGSPHLLTAGGGGAFLHPTHLLPDEIALDDWAAEGGSEQIRHFRRKTMFPTLARSRVMAFGNLLFSFRNLTFCAFLGSFYFVLGWGIRRAVKVSSQEGVHSGIYDAFQRFRDSETHAFGNELEFMATSFESPSVLALGLALVLGFAGFSMAFSGCASRLKSSTVGGLHGLLHLLLVCFLFWSYGLFAHREGLWEGAFWDELNAWIIFYPVFMFLLGGFLGGTLMGMYLLTTNLLFHWHPTEAFSSMAYEGFKNFIRIRVDKNGATFYPVGVRSVEKRWKFNPGSAPSDPYFLPASRIPLVQRTQLIEKPLEIESTKRAR